MAVHAYLVTAAIVGVLTAIVGTWLAIENSKGKDAVDLGLYLMVAILCAAPIFGFGWPVMLPVTAIWVVVTWVRSTDDRRKEAERKRRFAPTPENDHAKFARLAREQRTQARAARRDGQECLARMHDELADQNEQIARIYQRETR